MELSLYNATLTGMSLDGKRFTYVNQLASSDSDLSKREEWFTCACCPPNVTRLLGYLGGCLWTSKGNAESKTVNGVNGINGANGVNGMSSVNGINGVNGVNGVHGTQGVSINVHLYNSATINVPTKKGSIKLSQETSWPLDGTVNFSLEADQSEDVTVRLRIPSWATSWEARNSTSQNKTLPANFSIA